MNKCFVIRCWLTLCVWCFGSIALSQDDFAQVAEILSTRCVNCHNDDDQKGGVSLVSLEAMQESGVLESGDSLRSSLYSEIVSHDLDPPAMPKGGTALTQVQTTVIKNWIENGTPWPKDTILQAKVFRDFDWWSFKPIADHAIPEFSNQLQKNWIRKPIDAFVLKAQLENNLQFSPEVDRRTWLRRVSYDLTGLPPTMEEVEAFENDSSELAYEKVVDRLLASPRYGERWAQHWLDIVKYADTCGYDKDKLRQNAWPYRDYVIRSINEDKPYAQFAQEQMAGDILFPGSPDGILGLGFIAAGPWDFIGHVEVPESKIDGMVARNLDRDEMVTNTFNTFASLTVQCARCHDHKFDPFSQKDYYQLQTVFAAVDRAERVYDKDLDLVKKEKQLNQEVSELIGRRLDLRRTLAERGGITLEQMEETLAKLKAQPDPEKNPAFGYHGEIATSANVEQWVEVDWGSNEEIKEIVLRPCHDDFAGIGAGFGFPVRYRVELDGAARFDTEDVDYVNPGMQPVRINVAENASSVKVVVSKLAPRGQQFNFALAEIQVFNSQGVNVALHAKVNAKNSVEAPVRWAKSNLTDGIWFEGIDQAKKSELLKLEDNLKKLQTQVLGELADEWKRLPETIQKKREEIRKLPKGKMVYAAATHFLPEGNFKPTEGQSRPIRFLVRGDINNPSGEPLQPAMLPLANETFDFQQSLTDLSEGQRRKQLALWMTDQNNPLFWRSIVNRVWQHHFGTGLVPTPNDFGRMGGMPSHPKLLDWLARRFRESGGSLKGLHRELVLSSTYRQSSQNNDHNIAIDASNRFLWRMPRRKLSVEEVRDTILMASGKMDWKMGGPGFYLFQLEKTEHSPHFEYHKFDHQDPASYRRSIYRFVVRSQPDPFMATLDCADRSQSTPARGETQTALQALSLLNNDFTLVMAEHFASQIEESDNAAIIDQAFRRLLARSATEGEIQILEGFLQKHGKQNLARALFNLGELIFID